MLSALDAARYALGLADTPDAKTLVYRALKAAVPGPHLHRHRDLLTRSLMEHWGPPSAFARAITWLFVHDPLVVAATARVQAGGDSASTLAGVLGSSGVDELISNTLFHCVLLLGRVPDPGLEALLTAIRAALLNAALQSRPGSVKDESLLSFAGAMAELCFNNEYVFSCSEIEREAVRELRAGVAVSTGQSIPALWLAAIAAYEPLHALQGIDPLLTVDWPKPIRSLFTQQVVDPRHVRARMKEISQLTVIEDSVSLAVSQQYEENPYPRWRYGPSLQRPQTLQAHLAKLFPVLRPKVFSANRPLDYLIAGCGTGQQIVQVVEKLSDVRVTAIDLSRASLAYAMHITSGIPDIRFAQADILKLGSIAGRFDVIDASGVLHHMADWQAGWRELLFVLRERGLMRVALYSEIARLPVVAARRLIAEHGYSGTPDDIRLCRREIVAQPQDANTSAITDSWDFYSLSDCRDLLFHVQERRLTLRQIEQFLAVNDLDFLGFEQDAAVMRRTTICFRMIGLGQSWQISWHSKRNIRRHSSVCTNSGSSGGNNCQSEPLIPWQALVASPTA